MINRDAKIFNKKLAIHIQQLLKRSYDLVEFIPGMQGFFSTSTNQSM